MKSQLNEGRVDLNGMSYAFQGGAGTTNVVLVGANTKGIKLAVAGLVTSDNVGATACINAGGNGVLVGRSNGAGPVALAVTNVFVPPGVALDLIGIGANCRLWVWYEVL